MCTASWLREESGYWVFFNRDERLARREALPPREETRDGVRYLAPMDGDFGGTWIAVNELGVTMCLLNRYGTGALHDVAAPISRGILLAGLAGSGLRAEATTKLRAYDLDDFRPFSLLVFDLEGGPTVHSWDGSSLAIGEVEGNVFVSSSLAALSVAATRKATLAKAVAAAGGLSPNVLRRFHSSHEPSRGAYSPCMHRDDARTVSYTAVRVDGTRAELEYHPGSPCEARAPIRRHLPLCVAASCQRVG